MTRYHFHVRNSDGTTTQDPEGVEFDTLELAVADAKLAACEIVAEQVKKGDVVRDDTFTIVDGEGTLLDEVPFRSVVRLH